jgi:hypothetical protein
VPSALTAIVLEALHQFAGPRARANAFHIRVSCWGLGRSFRDAALDPATTGARVTIERPGRLLKRAKLLLTEATEPGRSRAKTALVASSPAIPGLMPRDGSLILSHVRAEKADHAAGDAKLTDLLRTLADCPLGAPVNIHDRCKAVYGQRPP